MADDFSFFPNGDGSVSVTVSRVNPTRVSFLGVTSPSPQECVTPGLWDLGHRTLERTFYPSRPALHQLLWQITFPEIMPGNLSFKTLFIGFSKWIEILTF